MDDKQSLIDAHERIKPYIHRTPILTCSTITKQTGCSALYFKCENFQKTGVYKPRGAFNKLLQLENVTSVCTHSSGNHAQGLAYAASTLKIPAYIVMPENRQLVKKKAVEGYGVKVIESGNTIQEREAMVQKVIQEHNSVLVHPFDDKDIIMGQATVAKEIFQEIPDLDYLVVPIGGGGLIAGSIFSIKHFGKNCKLVGVEPEMTADAKASIKSGLLEPQVSINSLADGLSAPLGKLNFEIIKQHLHPDDIILVSEQQIVEALQLVMERMKVVIEPSSATVVAALLKDERFKDKKVAAIFSGGNVNMSSLFEHMRSLIKQ